MNDIVINKIQSLQRCVARAREEHAAAGGNFASDHSRQDAAVLNVVRACELVIDLANHLVRVKKLGIPTESAQSFDLLEQSELIDENLARRMRSMVGFRNVAVHDYRALDLDIVSWVIREGLSDLETFAERVRLASG